MKIAINTRFLLKDKLEGIGWYTYEVCRHMVKNNPNDQFFFLFDRPYSEEFLFAENVTPIVVSPPARHPILFYIWFEFGVHRILKKIKPDVFYSTDGFLSMRTKVPSYVTIHDIAHVHYPGHISWSMRKYYQFFMPKFAHKAKKIFTVSEFSKKDICQTYKILDERVQVFYNGCRDHFRPLTLNEKNEIRKKYTAGNPYFVCIGSIHPRKNIAAVILAFDQFKRKHGTTHNLKIIGRKAWKTGPFVAALEHSPFNKEIILTGNVDDKLLVNLLGSATALVYPSLFEGFGIPVLEAFHTEIPVICSDTSSLPEVGGEAVCYIDPTRFESIADAMFKITSEPNFTNELIEKGKKQKLKFDWSKVAQGIYANFK